MRDVRFVKHVAAAALGASLVFGGVAAGVSSLAPTASAQEIVNTTAGKVDVDALNIRSAPGLGSSIITTLPYGTHFTLFDGDTATADGYTWYHLRLADGTLGWAVQGFITGADLDDGGTAPNPDYFHFGDTVTVNTDLLNVRSLPSITASILTVYGYGTVATVTGPATGGGDGITWYPVDNLGWVAGQYLVANGDGGTTPTTPDDEIINLTVTADVLNVRSGPSVDSTIVGTRYFHDLVTFYNRATAADGSTWIAINAAETQWVSNQFVDLHPDPNAAPL